MRRSWLSFPIVALLLAAASADAREVIHAYYFAGEGCHGCETGLSTLDKVIRPDPDVSVLVLDINNPQDFQMAHALLTVIGLGPEELPTAPALLVGDTYLHQSEFSEKTVRAALARYRATGAPALDERARRIAGHASRSLPSRFRRFGVLTVIGAGLLDGVNPCAFATLVFLIGYLGYSGARGARVGRIGLLFAAGVFVAYLAFGLGILHAVLALEGFPILRRVVHGLLGGGCLVLAGLSLYDWRQARAGRFSAMKLQLPGLLKRQTHQAVRDGVRSRYLGPMAFVMGATVSALEFACTGQMYIPAITYMASLAQTRATAIGWLLLYDAMFIVPVLVLLGLACSGMSSKHLVELAQARSGPTKALMGAFFLLAGAFFVLKAADLL